MKKKSKLSLNEGLMGDVFPASLCSFVLPEFSMSMHCFHNLRKVKNDKNYLSFLKYHETCTEGFIFILKGLIFLNRLLKMQVQLVWIETNRNLSSEFYHVYWLSWAPWWVVWSAYDFKCFLRQLSSPSDTPWHLKLLKVFWMKEWGRFCEVYF